MEVLCVCVCGGGFLRPTKGVLYLQVATSETNTFPLLAPDPGSSWLL